MVVILDTFLYPQLQVCSMPKSDARLAQQTHQLKTHLSYWTFWYQKKRILVPKKNFLAARRRLHQEHFYFLSFYRVWSEKWSYNIRKSISLNFSFAKGSKNHGGSLWYTYSTPPSSLVKYLAKYQSLGPENCRVFAKEEERGHTCHCCRHLLPQSILSLFKKDIPTHLRSLGSSVPIRLNITFTH